MYTNNDKSIDNDNHDTTTDHHNMYACMYIYIYIYRERYTKPFFRELPGPSMYVYVCMCVYIYIYIYIYCDTFMPKTRLCSSPNGFGLLC